jgi:hypothetical protein
MSTEIYYTKEGIRYRRVPLHSEDEDDETDEQEPSGNYRPLYNGPDAENIVNDDSV